MKKFLIIIGLICLCFLSKTPLFASSAPIDTAEVKKLTTDTIQYQEKKENSAILYIQKNENKKEIVNIKVNDIKKDNVLSEATRRINAIYPDDIEIATNTFPGYRGAN